MPEHTLAWGAARCSTAAPTPARFIRPRRRSQALQLTAAMRLPKHTFTGSKPMKRANKKPPGWVVFCLAPQTGYSPVRGNVCEADKRVWARNEPYREPVTRPVKNHGRLSRLERFEILPIFSCSSRFCIRHRRRVFCFSYNMNHFFNFDISL